MSNNGRNGVWQNVNVRRLILTLVWAYMTLASGWAVSVIEQRRLRGLLLIPLAVFAALFVRSFKKLMSDRLQEAIERGLGRLARWALRPAVIVVNKIAGWLGIGRFRGWCEDERTYIGRDRDKAGRRAKRLKNDQKWADQRDNGARVRFLYIEYMIKRIRAGYLLRRQLTPREVADELMLDEEERLLFETYNTVRYASSAEVSDETVKTLARTVGKKS